MGFSALIKGMGFGLVLSSMIGPVFFGLLQTSLMRGFRGGVHYALGVAASDVCCIILCYFGIARLLSNPANHEYVMWVGSVFMCVFGVYYLIKKAPTESRETKTASKKSIIAKGFLLNILTPSVIFFWIGTMGFVSVTYVHDPYSILLFFAGCILILFAMDLVKSYMAGKIRQFLKPRFMLYMQKMVGLVFLFVGIVYIIRLLFPNAI